MRIVMVDDDRLVCASLKTILEADPNVSVVGVGYDGKQAIELYRKLKPDILLMDIRMSAMSGLEAADTILKSDRSARILFLTTFSDDEYIIKALKIGARGYIIKQNFESVVPSLKAVHSGQNVFGDDIVAKIPSLISNDSKIDYASFGITEKEWDIIVEVAQGLNNREIAEKLYLSEGTVRNSISTILEKLNLRDRTQLAILYHKNRA